MVFQILLNFSTAIYFVIFTPVDILSSELH